ncbi:MAG TPA: hypothetical protein VNK03_00640 [Gammaproteobacteria bacterium]|nr:hypothetical protein [Gammaproteobacteria bacterium]
MKIDKLFIYDNIDQQLCKDIFKVLSCNSLWIMNLNNDVLNMVVTDQSIWGDYWDKKYYLHDPILNAESNNDDAILNSESTDDAVWEISLGTDCESFNQCGFLYDLYKIFNVEEFVSIQKKIGTENYCFRFFTKNNRFIFMNKLLNDMAIIKHFINLMINKIQVELPKQRAINTLSLKEN